jgi:hypothetical protein
MQLLHLPSPAVVAVVVVVYLNNKHNIYLENLQIKVKRQTS